MKTALILAGPLREFQHCSENILKNIVKPTNTDVYMYFTTPNSELEAVNIYNPKAYGFEKEDKQVDIPQICLDKERYTNTKHSKNIFQMWRKIQLCCDLIEERYDWIIKFRFDCKLQNCVLDNDFFAKLNQDYFYLPKGGDWGGYNDMMCISGHTNMRYYCNLYNNLINYATKSNLPFGFEELVKYHLSYQTVKRFNCDIILRKNFDGQVEDRKFNI